MPKSLGYLSGAPRVSTRLDAEAAGSRSHILGVMGAFQSLGWEVEPFIVGDKVPASWTKKGKAQLMKKSPFHRLMADFARIGLGIMNTYRVHRELGQVDWVYERFASFQALGWLLKRKGIPWILETQGLFYFEAYNDRKSILLRLVAELIEKWAYRNCDILICITESLKDMLIEEAGLNPNKIVIIRNGVDTSFFDPSKYAARKILHKGVVIGYVGGLIAWQGLDLLIDALFDLKKEEIEIGLVVVGDGPMRSKWESLTRKRNLHDRVRFIGLVPFNQVPKYIAGFDIGYSGQVPMQFGKMYCSPLKLYEYMSMAKPVISSANEDAINAVVHGETGYLYVQEDKESLKEVLRQAYNERNRFHKMGQRARKEVETKHSWICRVETMIERVEGLLKVETRDR